MKIKEIGYILLICLLVITSIGGLDNIRKANQYDDSFETDDIDIITVFNEKLISNSIQQSAVIVGLSSFDDPYSSSCDIIDYNFPSEFTASINSPEMGAMVNGIINIKVLARSYPNPIDQVEFYIGNQKFGTSLSIIGDHYIKSLNTHERANGFCSIKIIIFNTAGQSIIRSININIKN